MGRHVEAGSNSFGKAPAGSWAGICEADFKSAPVGSDGDETVNVHEGCGTLDRKGFLTLQDLMPRRNLKAVVAGPIALESCWRAARRHGRSKSAPELVSAAVAYANLGASAHDPGVAKAHLTRALHLANKAEGEADSDVLNAIRVSAFDSLARAEMSMGNPERSASCRRAAATIGAACSPRHEIRVAAVGPSVVGAKGHGANGRSFDPYIPAA